MLGKLLLFLLHVGFWPNVHRIPLVVCEFIGYSVFFGAVAIAAGLTVLLLSKLFRQPVAVFLVALILTWQLGTSMAQSPGVSPLNFLSVGLGAVQRTVETKLSDQCSVKDFGAVGDGSTDDTAAINKALAACYNVLFPTPATSYKTTTPLMERSGNWLHGAGNQGTTKMGVYIDCAGIGPCLSASFLPEGQYTSGGTHTGSSTQTCTLTFLGGGGGTATVALTGTNTIAAGTALTAFAGGGLYNPAPTTATLSSGTATCSGTATVFITAPGAGTRGLTTEGLYLEDNYGSRSATNGDGIYYDGGTDALIFDLENTHIYGFGNSFTLASTINSRIGGHTRFDVPKNNGLNLVSALAGVTGLASTGLNIDSAYVDAPTQDCYSYSDLVGGTQMIQCDSAGRDGVHMDSALAPSGITFHPEMEACARYCFFMEGQSHVIDGGSLYVVDAAAHECIYLDNVAQIIINGTVTRNGDYGIYFPGTGALVSFYANQPIVTVLGIGNYTAGSFEVKQVYDPNGLIRYPDVSSYCLTGGTATAYTCAHPNPVSALNTGNAPLNKPFLVKMNATNTGASPTINFDSLGAMTLYRQGGGTIQAGDLVSGQMYEMVYDYNGSANDIQVLGLHSLANPTICSNGSSPATCGAATHGSVAVPAGTTSVTLVVDTSAVTSTSIIVLTVDDSATISGTTCNTTAATTDVDNYVSARSAGTSFSIFHEGTISTNPVCVDYLIIN